MNRRSGIANDIYIRCQKRDNITVEVDGTKVYGACPNRMDPPVSHILANQIDEIEVIEGPYDVETFGTLSGGLKIKTKKPTKEEKAEINVGFGSWNYKKFAASVSGGNDRVRAIATASMESSDQYHDGDGNSIAQQIDKYVSNTTLAGTTKDPRLQPAYYDMPAYTKKSAMAKAFIKTAKNQELRLSATANRSDNVLYGNSKMDAIYDDSNIYSIEYNIDNISDAYKNINIQYYHSDVDHPMGTDYRMSSINTGGAVMTNWLKTNMDGLKLKNKFDLSGYKLLLGLDTSERKWDGNYYKNGSAALIGYRKSIDNAVTKNAAAFAKLSKKYNALNISIGARYDDTEITHATLNTNNYSSLGANILGTYNLNKDNKFFLGIGQAYRVPDARELYFVGSMGNTVGTPDLKQTTNQEVDLGYETNNDDFKLKIKAFYSMLKDYIYYNKNNTTDIMGQTVAQNSFENIDATIYGAELSASYYASDDISIDISASYKRGQKDEALSGQTDKDLADIAPLRGKIAANYEYANNSIASIEVQASDKWSNYDSDNGEQELGAWTIVNAKVKHAVNKKFDFTLGVNNLLDQTYALSNTYADLTLITGGTTDVMLMNEPGRYIYTNLDFKF
jgi:iron complex outermembrane receptor protein